MRKSMEFKIEKILTHNILLATNEKKDYMLVGKGIGFQKKPGAYLQEENVESFYVINNTKNLNDYVSIVLETPETILLTTEQAISLAERRLNTKFDESLHISLLDHLNFAVFRLNNNIKVGSFLTDEYFLLYPQFYSIAQEMVNLINRELNIVLPNTEVGAIILHLHAALNNEQVSNTALYAQIIDFSLSFIQDKFSSTFSNNVFKVRLITHLRFALKRSEDRVSVRNPMIDIIEEQYDEYFKVAQELSDQIADKFSIQLTRDEIGYITLHIYNMDNSK